MSCSWASCGFAAYIWQIHCQVHGVIHYSNGDVLHSNLKFLFSWGHIRKHNDWIGNFISDTCPFLFSLTGRHSFQRFAWFHAFCLDIWGLMEILQHLKLIQFGNMLFKQRKRCLNKILDIYIWMSVLT